ncbi:heat shock factor protein 5 [Brachyhypopomus gauderio]|uniref:heat shock factor protein 5 n=1 Tax=Brachyhypopomus gauderio TaxID=698409 RepID=UPI00404165C6
MVMELDEALLSLPINPNNFPAKLWRLVNSPLKRSIRWDSRGDGIIIDQQMFEAELLSPSSVVVGQTLRGLPRENAAAYQYHLGGSRQKESDRASIPPNAWIMGSGDVSSATTFYTDRGVPVSLIRRFPTDSCMIQSNPTSGIMQHGSQNISAIGQKFTHTFIPHHSQYRTGFFAPVCHGCIPDSLDSDMSCSHHPPASYYNYGFCPTYSVGCLQPSGPDLDLKAGDGLEPKKSDVNLDTVFKIVDELQGSPRVCFAKVTTPEKSLSSPPASSSYNPTGSALRSTSAPALRQHTVRSPSPRVRPTPVDGTVVAVPGKDAPSSQPETGTKRRLEQRPSKAEEATVGSSTKAAGAAMADLSEEQARG